MANRFKVVFVLGGPGSGKGTQCQLIQRAYHFLHLSAGQLLREERMRHQSPFGETIERFIVGGQIVPSHITVSLLQAAMQTHFASSRSSHFLIDGFPRNMENLTSWLTMTKQTVECPFILHIGCDRDEMLRRLLIRSKISQRSDDNEEVIRKRFTTYESDTMEVVRWFKERNKVKEVSGCGSIEEIFARMEPIFSQFLDEKRCG